MANNYTKMSEYICMPKEAIDYLVASIAKVVESDDDEHDEEHWLGCDTKREAPDLLWVFTEENVNMDLLSDLIQETMEKFNLDGCITIEWADYCDKLRISEFGGGCVAITKNDTYWCQSHAFRYDHEKAVPKENK